jgi:peptide/nickel transport system permease protein
VYFERDEEAKQLNGEYSVIVDGQTGMSILNNFVPVETKYDKLNTDYRFIDAAEKARAEGTATFTYDGETYTMEKYEGHDAYTVYNASGEKAVLISEIAYGPFQNGTELTIDFVLKFQDAVWQPSNNNEDKEFHFVNQYGEEKRARLHVSNENNEVWTEQNKTLIDARAPLSSAHLLGTDVYGMDVLTRLMYGGRISLLVGFVVIFFEIIIGVIIGGISGYFGGVVDTILMRFVELFNAIPFYPMLIILGSVMDNMHVTSTARLMLTMAILGILGWTGIARTVRGQILSLREQDFMIATEATGIRTSRRIFKHLVPNVMPLLIVYATAGLGSVILTEATLGFLGLGVKYPMASWGSIINQALDMRVMSTNWWIWIPAGILILATVLGFNFVGDGLRDAFDPKMKR